MFGRGRRDKPNNNRLLIQRGLNGLTERRYKLTDLIGQHFRAVQEIDSAAQTLVSAVNFSFFFLQRRITQMCVPPNLLS